MPYLKVFNIIIYPNLPLTAPTTAPTIVPITIEIPKSMANNSVVNVESIAKSKKITE